MLGDGHRDARADQRRGRGGIRRRTLRPGGGPAPTTIADGIVYVDFQANLPHSFTDFSSGPKVVASNVGVAVGVTDVSISAFGVPLCQLAGQC
jgi:hypothetical protein